MQMYSVTFEGSGLTDDRREALWRGRWIVESYEPPVAEVRGHAVDAAEAVAKVKAALGEAAGEFSNFDASQIFIRGDVLQ